MNVVYRFPFDDFMKWRPPDGELVPAPAEVIEAFADRVPSELVEFWTTHGLGSFGSGALWFEDPRQIIEEAHALGLPETSVPFARTAFADLFTVDGEAVSLTLVQPNYTALSSPRLDIWGFNYFRHPEDTDAILKTELRVAAERMLGELGPGECYGLKLALPLGGDEVPENMRKCDMRVYLDLLASIHAS